MEQLIYQVFTHSQVYTIEATYFSASDDGIVFYSNDKDDEYKCKTVGFVPFVSLDFIQIAPPKQTQEEILTHSNFLLKIANND